MPKDPKLCRTKYCRKTAKDGGLCHPCRYKKKKEVNLIRVVYQTIKDNATRRNKRFVITIEEFKEFCEENNYLELRGKSADSASIDCIIDEIGYAKGNIKILSLSNNTLKRNKKIVYDHIKKEYVFVRQAPQPIEEDLPF